jgi:hypothetical protein
MTMFAVSQAAIQSARAAEGTPGQGVEKRVERQNKRIARKLEKKKMTEAQADQLKKEVSAVEAKKDDMVKANNGKRLNKTQRKELQSDLKKTSEEIKAVGSPATTH